MAEPALKLGLLLLALASCRREPTALPLSFECRDCHRAEVEALSTSHHARGQAVADAGWFFTSEEGGALAVRYTLGVSPIVQVVVETATGRLQVPPMGLVDGGWVHVPTPLEGAAADWEGPAFNWNGSCAGCHATGFQVQPLDGGASRWRSLHVECEACHGETAGHRAWLAEGKRAGQGAGFTVSLAARTTFTFVDGGSIARPGPARVDAQSNACAACHSRRRALRDDGAVAGPLFDRFEPALLAPGLYEPSGAIADEVFESGSFFMSAMQRAGVRCTDCHEPHSSKLLAPGSAVCAKCHRGHGAPECVSCHMPTKVFLGVHVRHDHSFSVRTAVLPREVPSGLEGRGVPVPLETRNSEKQIADFTEAFSAAFTERADAPSRLVQLAADERVSPFKRASALALLQGPWNQRALDALSSAARSEDVWLRYGAASALSTVPPAQRVELGAHLTTDVFRAIRVRAGRALSGVMELSPELLAELDEAERANAFRGDAWLNRGSLALARGDVAGAERDFREGLRVDPAFTPLLVNLADLLRAKQRDAEGRALLEAEATRTDSTWRAPLSYALGLARWRAGEKTGALEALRLAAKDASTVHLRALCLAERELHGKREGWRALEAALQTRPDTAVLLTLAAQWAREDGQTARATAFTARLEELSR